MVNGFINAFLRKFSKLWFWFSWPNYGVTILVMSYQCQVLRSLRFKQQHITITSIMYYIQCVGPGLYISLQWHQNGLDSVSNHQPHDCLLNCLFRCRSKKTSKLRITGLCAGNSPGTGEFPAQMACKAKNVSIWWRPHVVKEHNGWQQFAGRHIQASQWGEKLSNSPVTVCKPLPLTDT